MDICLRMAKETVSLDFSLDHARHNEKVLKYLDKEPTNSDWVITVAFYSALHYVRYKIFPLTVKKANGDNHIHITFDNYCSYHRYDNLGKHEMLLGLVAEHCPEIAYEYNQLKDMCWTAR